MTVISNRNSVNDMLGTPFDDYANAMAWQRANALVTDACDRDSVDREPGRAYADDFSSMRGGIVKADDIRHIQASLDG